MPHFLVLIHLSQGSQHAKLQILPCPFPLVGAGCQERDDADGGDTQLVCVRGASSVPCLPMDYRQQLLFPGWLGLSFLCFSLPGGRTAPGAGGKQGL